MRLFAEKPKVERRPRFKELGATGTQFFSGYIRNEEFLTKLEGQKAIDVYDKMRRQDSLVKGLIQSITLPIRQANWYVEPASDLQEDKDIAERIQEQLIYGMSITWDDFMRQALTYLPMGYSIFEKVWEAPSEENGGIINLRKLAPRLQKTLWKWFQDDSGGLKGIQQYVQQNGEFRYIDIDVSKLVLFVNELEGSNFEGISILRPAYRNYYIKNELYKIDAIGHDRFASGVPFAEEPETANDDDRSRASTILENLRSRERSYMVVPHGWKLGILEKSGDNKSIIDSIKQHNNEMAQSILAQFINLGSTESGSRALGESFEELFMLSLNAVAGYVADVMNRYVIREWVDYNWNVEEYPRLKYGRIVLNVYRYLDAVGKMIQVGGLSNDMDTEKFVRELIGLPVKREETMTPQAAKKPEVKQVAKDEGEAGAEAEVGPTEMHECACGKSVMLREYRRTDKRALTLAERELIDLDTIEITLNEAEERFRKQIKRIRMQQAQEVAEQVVSKQADKVKVPYVGKMASRLADEYIRLYKIGKEHVRSELKAQEKRIETAGITLAAKKKPILAPEPLDDAEAIQALKDKAISDATIMANKVENEALFAARGFTSEAEKIAIIDGIVKALSQQADKDIDRTVFAAINSSYSEGRSNGAREFAEQIEYGVYSAVLDTNTCDNCLPKDGVKHELDDPDFVTPNPGCLGGDQCRCMTIYKLEGMEGDFYTKSEEEYARDVRDVESGKLTPEKVRERYFE